MGSAGISRKRVLVCCACYVVVFIRKRLFLSLCEQITRSGETDLKRCAVCGLSLIHISGISVVRRNTKSHRRKSFATTMRLAAKYGSCLLYTSITREKILALMGDLPRIELFARQHTPGWDVWGNEIKSDIRFAGKEV